tara:strand:- start:46 stop:330 length:285 start_codon:yes stop_codon:yes gene_type:complete
MYPEIKLYVANSTKKGNCVSGAEDLRDAKFEGKGRVYFVNDSAQGVPIYHAYFIPEDSKPNDAALNSADNGYGGYPRLTVDQVEQWGHVIPSRS